MKKRRRAERSDPGKGAVRKRERRIKMKPQLTFTEQKIRKAQLGEEASVPDLSDGQILQNRMKFFLGEEDEIYEGYGRLAGSWPYRQFSCYGRELREENEKAAILENDYLRAVFLPEYGGRLWSLWDKREDRNLLYTNEVLRFSNLAVRNAWFAGGVEWNVGVIGHSPFTTAPLFAARLKMPDGTPVLRMYEYERIRQVTWQMDFWLGENDRFLNARMRIVNFGETVTPMYWWSNIAVPEEKGGRILVPASEAFTFRNWGVYKVPIPMVDGTDISHYENIPASVDYFFDIPDGAPKYIAHADASGYGLLHLSTDRLRSRKLFSWGSRPAADHWQEFLSDGNGRYVEIQAGLGKTQYGCIPMAPHTAWEWLERYGALQLEEKQLSLPFEAARDSLTEQIGRSAVYLSMNEVLRQTKSLAKQKAQSIWQGSGFGAMENQVRAFLGEDPVSPHLDYGEPDEEQKRWLSFLKTGRLHEPEITQRPDVFLCGAVWKEKLQETITGENRKNWYAHYHLGLFAFRDGDNQEARRELEASLALKKNPWALHGLAAVCLAEEKRSEAAQAMAEGIRMRREDLSYLKEGFRLLARCSAWEEILALYPQLSETMRADGRLRFYECLSLSETGDAERALALLEEDGGLVPDDVREGETNLGGLWKKLQKELTGKEAPVPYRYDFEAL